MLDADFQYHDRSPGGMLVGLAHHERMVRRRVARAEPVERELMINGRREPFVFLGVDTAWVATRQQGGVEVMVSACAIVPDDVRLEPLANPADAQAGTIGDVERAAERARRDAAGELLGRAEVLRLIARHDLSEHRERVLAAIRPGYWLVPGNAARTRIGGLPDLAPGEAWPHGDDGTPYTFVAQIDCSALPPMVSAFAGPAWGHGGALVRIFAALDGRVPEPGPAIALACAADAPVARAELPPWPDLDDDSLRRLHELPVRLVPFLSARIAFYAAFRGPMTTTRSPGGSPRVARATRSAVADPSPARSRRDAAGEDPASTARPATTTSRATAGAR